MFTHVHIFTGPKMWCECLRKRDKIGVFIFMTEVCIYTDLCEDRRDDCGQAGRFTQLILNLWRRRGGGGGGDEGG